MKPKITYILTDEQKKRLGINFKMPEFPKIYVLSEDQFEEFVDNDKSGDCEKCLEKYASVPSVKDQLTTD
jgi:hypothetical protein